MCVTEGKRATTCEFLEEPIEEIVLKDTCYSMCGKKEFCPSKAMYEGLVICQRYTRSYRTASAGGQIMLY